MFGVRTESDVLTGQYTKANNEGDKLCVKCTLRSAPTPLVLVDRQARYAVIDLGFWSSKEMLQRKKHVGSLVVLILSICPLGP